MVRITASFFSTVVVCRLRATLMATGSAQRSSTTCARVLTATKKKSSDQSWRLSAWIPFRRPSIFPTRTHGATDQPFTQRADILLASTRTRLKLDKLESTFLSPSLSPCSHSLATRLACGALLTSTARAPFNSTLSGRLSLLAGRKIPLMLRRCPPLCQL